MQHLVRLLAKILLFAVFTTMEFYSCETIAFMCDRRLSDQVRYFILLEH